MTGYENPNEPKPTDGPSPRVGPQGEGFQGGGISEESLSKEEQDNEKRSLPAVVIITVSVVLGIILMISALWVLGVFTSPEEKSTGTAPFVQILEPKVDSNFLVKEPVLIIGEAGGLVEGSLFVQVTDENGRILVEAPVSIIDQGESGGNWEVQVIVTAEPGSKGSVRAYAASPADGRVVAEDRVPVLFQFNPVEAYIDLIEPLDNMVVDPSQPVVVWGMAGGLFEGALVVEAQDAGGNILAQTPVLIDSPEAGVGGEGPWQAELSVEVQPGSMGYLRAYANSPKDGSLLVEDSVPVTFGETPPAVAAYIEILEPMESAVLDTNSPVTIIGMGAGLFEGNVVVEALDPSGNVLAVEAVVIQSTDAGIGAEGPWRATLEVPAEPGMVGTIRAFSPSPADGSIVAEDRVGVTYGQVEIPEEKPPLEATAWRLVSLHNEPLLEGSLVWALFEKDTFSEGTLNGFSGCNQYFSGYRVDGVALSIDPIASTRKACPETPGLMEQESAYTSLLESTASFAVEGNQLFLADSMGEIILVYTASVVGTVNAAAGSEMPEGAVVTIRLEDVSRADAQAETIAETQLAGITGFPFPFELPYDLEKIDPRMSYAVRVQVHDASGALLYTNTTTYPVLTRDFPLSVDVLVEAVQ